MACCGGRHRGQTSRSQLIELKGRLAVTGLGVGAADALDRAEAGGRGRAEVGAGCDGAELRLQLASLVVIGLELEGGLRLGEGLGGLTLPIEADREIVVVVLVGGVGRGGSLEERNGVFALPALGDSPYC